MSGRSKVWRAAAIVFVAINLGGAVFAAVEGELLHTCAHVLLLIPGTYLAARLFRRGSGGGEASTGAGSDAMAARLQNLEQSVDAVAIEIERIGEGQRFMTRVFGERAAKSVSDEADAKLSATQADQQVRPSPTG
jgi:hypothetical protein